MSAGQSENNNEGDEGKDGENKDAAFGTSGSSTEDGFAYWVSGEEVVLDHEPTIGHAIQERLTPVP